MESSPVVFNARQWRWIGGFTAAAMVVGWLGAVHGFLDFFKFSAVMTTVSAMLLGFSFTAFALMVNAAHAATAGSFLKELLFQADGYYSVVKNARWLVICLFYNMVIGAFFLMVNRARLEALLMPGAIPFLQALLLGFVTFTGALLYYAVSRYMTVISRTEREDSKNQ